MRRSVFVTTLTLGALLLAPLPARSADPLDPEKVKAAIHKGVEWLKARQSAEGTFLVEEQGGGKEPIGHGEASNPEGTTALALLTLLKCGVKPDDPAINKGFDWLMQQPPRRTYSVALTILAIEARFQPTPEQVDKDKKRPYETVARDKFNKIARPEDKKWLDDLVKWLLAQQQVHVWRYPSKDTTTENQDNSCTQYAVMALKSASRLGFEISPDVWKRVAQYFIEQQDATGPDVEAFPIPAADGSIAPHEKPAVSATVDKTSNPTHSMHARGWGYLPRPPVKLTPADAKGTKEKDPGTKAADPEGGANGGGANARAMASYGSMTCSGVAALVICKSELEKDKAWSAAWGPHVDQGIRDGCAWLAHHFSVTANPLRRQWFYYYLYGLERAGVLAGTYELGKHDWYDEGALHLLGLQGASGAWPTDGHATEFANTCFALLFLKRGTIPLVKMPPKKTITGVGGAEPPVNAKPGK